MDNYEMLEYINKCEKHIWVGRKSPYEMTSIELLSSSNYRVSNTHHHRYDCVWFYELLLDDVGKLGWKIVVDELLRLLGRHGYLIIRMRDNRDPSVPMLKSFLGRHIGIDAEVDYENYDKEYDVWIVVFKIIRHDIEKYSKKDWTFAILTSGKKVNNVIRFLKSIRNNEPQKDSEIIIVGPYNEKYNQYNVKYIDVSQFRDDKYAEICKKKNAVIDMASKTNLMIVHDRFVLDTNFFIGFEKYGYDFDFITVAQFTEDGNEYPGYAATNESLRLSGQIYVQELRHLYDNSYLNGGLIILKTHIARKIKFNSMLMWCQMEDAELTRVYMANGIIPRVNYISRALVLEVPKGYMASWIYENDYISQQKKNILSEISDDNKSLSLRTILFFTRRMPKQWKNSHLYKKVKNIYFSRRQV